MKIAGIVTEYNPFHNGHSHLIREIRKFGMTHIVSVMSGSFVQRGEPAIFDKWTRARAALSSGVDLVLELPTQYAMSSAGRFATASVSILGSLPIDTLCFGSEIGSISDLNEALNAVVTSEAHPLMTQALKKGVSYPRGLCETISALFGARIADIVANPNNLLAIEYMKASKKLDCSHDFFTIPRSEVSHDSDTVGESIASASYLRSLFKEATTEHALESIQKFVPDSAFAVYQDACKLGRAPLISSRLEIALLCRLRQMRQSDFVNLPDVSEGLENRLFDAAQKSISLNDFYERVKTKRYTHSRIRRIAYSSLIGITADRQRAEPQAVRILGMNSRGKEILSALRKFHRLPISPKFADIHRRFPNEFDIERIATDIALLAAPSPIAGGADFRESFIVY